MERSDVEVGDEDARGFGGVELLDFVPPALASELVERRLEAAGDEFFVEAWGANLLGSSRGRRGRRPHNCGIVFEARGAGW